MIFLSLADRANHLTPPPTTALNGKKVASFLTKILKMGSIHQCTRGLGNGCRSSGRATDRRFK